MKTLLQVYRRRVKTSLCMVLMVLSGAILCLTVGQFWAAYQTRASLERDFFNIASPNGTFRYSSYIDSSGAAKRSPADRLTQDALDYLLALPETAPEYVLGFSHTDLVSAYCPEAEPLDTELIPDQHVPSTAPDGPFSAIGHHTLYSILEFSLAEEPTLLPHPLQSGYVEVCATGTVTGVISLYSGYADPTGRRITATFVMPQAEADGIEWTVGDRYLAAGTYSDSDLQLRYHLANVAYTLQMQAFDPAEIDWDRDVRPLSDAEKSSADGNDYICTLRCPSRTEICYLTEQDVASIRACAISGTPVIIASSFANTAAYYGVTEAELVSWLTTANIQHISAGSSAEAVLQEPLWQRAAEEAQVYHHGVPVLATEDLTAMVPFAVQDVTVPQGRSFTQEEYASGAPVCLISESLAMHNGLSVGDHITLHLYQRFPADPLSYSNPRIYSYDPGSGFTQIQEYTIVGLYRQSREWSCADRAFSPNTVLVPRSSVTAPAVSGSEGCFATLLLKNGTSEALSARLDADGYPGLLDFFDRGYGAIQESLDGYSRVSAIVLALGIALWVLVLAVFLLLCPIQMKADARRMWAIGAPKRHIFRHIFVGGLAILVPASLLALVSSVVTAGRFTAMVTAAANADLALTITPVHCLILTVAALLAETVPLAAVAAALANPREEVRK